MVDNRQELLSVEFDELVKQGRCRADVVDDAVKALRTSIIVNGGVVELDGLPLSQAAAKYVEAREYMKPPAAIDPATESLRADQELAVSGNLSAQGRVRRSFGADNDKQATAAYEVWGKAQGVRLGKPAEAKSNGADSKNPWARGDKSEIARLLKTLPTAACVSMAKSAGTHIAGRPLSRT